MDAVPPVPAETDASPTLDAIQVLSVPATPPLSVLPLMPEPELRVTSIHLETTADTRQRTRFMPELRHTAQDDNDGASRTGLRHQLLRVGGIVGDYQVNVLIDSGASHNFLSRAVLELASWVGPSVIRPTEV